MENDPKSNSSNRSSLQRFWLELKRRKVMRVAITYAVMAWLIIQVASSTFGWFDIPKWAFQFVVIMLLTFFPVAILLAWAFELTPDGIKTTKAAREEASQTLDSARAQSKRAWMKIGLAAAAPTIIFGALAVLFYLQARTSDHGGEGPAIAQAKEPEKSIAVLPLINMSPDPENAFFADGVQEDVLTNLSKIDELRVISRTSTLRYRNTEMGLTEIGRELGVRYLVEGSVRRDGTQARVTVQLIDAANDEHLWAQNYDRSLTDIFAIQSEIAQQIADQLQTVISPKEIEQIEYRPTDNQEAYDLFVKVRQMIDSLTGTDTERIAMLERAVALDPDFAEAWAQLAIERLMLWVENERIPSKTELLDKAYQAFNEAKRLGPELAYIPYTQYHFEWYDKRNYEPGINHLLESLAIDPSFHLAQSELARRYKALGRSSEARHYHEAILQMDPLSPKANADLFSTYMVGLMLNEARDLILRNLEWTDRREEWLIRLAYVDYAITGDKPVYIADMDAIPGFMETAQGKAWRAIVLRDYPSALSQIEQLDPQGNISLLTGISLNFRPPSLVSALIHFERGDKENQLIETEKAKAYLKGRIEADPLISPNYLSNLLICYALEDEREQMETAILQVREQTSFLKWKYMYEAEFEFQIATAYLIAGDKDAAIESLTRADKLDDHDLLLKQELNLWFIFDRLRGDPRFDALLD